MRNFFLMPDCILKISDSLLLFAHFLFGESIYLILVKQASPIFICSCRICMQETYKKAQDKLLKSQEASIKCINQFMPEAKGNFSLAPLKLKRPQDYVPQMPENYSPPRKKEKTPKQPKLKPPKQIKPNPQKVDKQKNMKTPKPQQKDVSEKIKNFLPGQKHHVPDEDDGYRLYYESLLAEKPSSKLAMTYCLEHGLFDRQTTQNILAEEKGAKSKRLQANLKN